MNTPLSYENHVDCRRNDSHELVEEGVLVRQLFVEGKVVVVVAETRLRVVIHYRPAQLRGARATGKGEKYGGTARQAERKTVRTR